MGVSRLALAVSSGVLLVAVSACAVPGESGDSEGSEPSGAAQQAKALDGFDPCEFFEPDELASWGVSTDGEEFSPLPSEPGCKWSGDTHDVVIQKNVDETVDSYQQSGDWESYEKQSVAGREGAIALTPGTAAAGTGCNALIDSGGGTVIYQVTGDATESMDACAEVEDIASETASRLPE